MSCTCQQGIIIRQGDDTNALGNSIVFVLNTELDLTGFTAVFQVASVRYEWDDITSKRLELVLTAEQTAILPFGTSYGALKIYDPNGLAKTIIADIPVYTQPLIVENEEEDGGD